MSLTLNMVGGGGGGLSATDALLRVQAPANSVVTISKGTTTKTDMGHENADDHTVYDYYFIIHASQFDSVNPWTVTATKTVYESSDTIIIDMADEYDMSLNYRIPTAYQEVEYLQASGTQYIAPEITPVYGIYKFKAMWTEAPTSSTYYYRNAYGVSGGDSGTSQYVRIQSERKIECGTNTMSSQPVVALNSAYDIELCDTHTSAYMIVNGTTYAMSTRTATMTTSHDIYLFASNSNDAPKQGQNLKGRLYYFSVTNESGAAVANMIPCYRKSDSVAGFWDNVRDTFYTNAGTGTFTVGGNVT